MGSGGPVPPKIPLDQEDGSMVRLGFPGLDKLLYAWHIKKGGVEDLPAK
jgi:hypothetical protein